MLYSSPNHGLNINVQIFKSVYILLLQQQNTFVIIFSYQYHIVSFFSLSFSFLICIVSIVYVLSKFEVIFEY